MLVTNSRPILFLLLFEFLVDIILIVRFVLKRHDVSAKKCQRNYSVYFCAISCPKVTSKQAIALYSFAYFAFFITLVSNPHPFIASKVAWNLGYCWNYYVYAQLGKTDLQCSIFTNYYTTVKLGDNLGDLTKTLILVFAISKMNHCNALHYRLPNSYS